MKKKVKNNKISLSGFCGTNFGEICKSYCVANMADYKQKSSFCFKNMGSIDQCFATTAVKKSKLKCFCEQNSGVVANCFNDVDSNDANFEHSDGIYFCNFRKFKIKNILNECGIELSDKWFNLKGEENLFSIEIRKDVLSPISDSIGLEPVFIKSKDQLFDISKKILGGDIEAASAYYILNTDIDLKGKNWTPIGDINYPFRGIFDGRGHKIYNFKVTKKNLEFAGFFGVAENATIINLHVDGLIKSGKFAGGFVGLNKDSEIYSCCAVSNVIGNENVGGFVGSNKGHIEGCYYIGKIKKNIPFGWVWIFAALVFLILGYLYIFNPFKTSPVFNNVPIDPYAVKMSNYGPYSGEGNKVSFKFSDIVKFKDGVASFDFENAGVTNQSTVIKIQITDKELTDKIGKTGRTSWEQMSLNANPSYDPSNARVTVCESGLILPGYKAQRIDLKDLPDGSKLPQGFYSAIAYLNFFDTDTNEKAIIDSQFPIAIVVE